MGIIVAPIPHAELLTAAYKGELNRFKNGRGCLHFAAAGGSLNVCKYLIENLKLDVDSKCEKGCTPLYDAPLDGNFDTVRYLLEKGANPDVSTDTNLTPLHYAAKSGDTKIISLLLSKGVRLDVVNSSGTALQFAVALGHRVAVKVLLDHGANPNYDNSEGMLRPLISAVGTKSWECMELLLEAGADPNVASYGDTPLTFAAMDGGVEEVTRLLEAGADPNYKDNEGLTALEIVAIEGNYQNVGVLFPVTSRIPTYPDWSIPGLAMHVNSDANKTQREAHKKENFIRQNKKEEMHFWEKNI
ncbi:hypothetical protein MKW98_028394 [Papaver atlanticum]|uniref:Uncharacterized protein n=1 Tax=Papaver atlanticum TaxID=357466 RepID=A0AAD4XLZ8_9MAGN|nr:hypothetical protein MKW98_028394 [Papaver atlanticum]